jgi:hypothetical protein
MEVSVIAYCNADSSLAVTVGTGPENAGMGGHMVIRSPDKTDSI